MRIYRLENPVQRYPWGSKKGISDLFGIPNTEDRPMAEVWMGAHSRAASTAITPRGRVPLNELIEGDNESCLGRHCLCRLGPDMPFLFKILSAATPVSIQAHPGKRKAENGFERETLAGIPLGSSERNYRDPNHKPEMVVALTPFTTLCGFRPIPEILENLRLIDSEDLNRAAARLGKNPGKAELSVLFYGLFTAERSRRLSILEEARRGARRIRDKADRGLKESLCPFAWVLRLSELFPEDISSLMPIFLNLLELSPGQAVLIAPGELHAHLEGSCLEIMANSDNVIRGGLTRKKTDTLELISVLSFNPEKTLPVWPSPSQGCETSYPVYVPDFFLSIIELSPGQSWEARVCGPEILLCARGGATITGNKGETLALERGQSVFIEAAEASYAIASEDGAALYRASVPEIP